MSTILIIVVILLIFGGLGWGGYNGHFGTAWNGPYYGGGIGIGTILVILLVLYLIGVI